MTSREVIRNIIAGKPADRFGFWIGNPHQDSWPKYHEYFGTSTVEDVLVRLRDDMRWRYSAPYNDPEGRPLFGLKSLGGTAGPVFTNAEAVSDLDSYTWPNPDYLDIEAAVRALKECGNNYRLGGFWCPFFHIVADMFGMEEYFVKMYTHPEVVHAVTRRVVDFYLEANRRLFAAAGKEIDGFFFGNDFGTQIDLLVSPDSFDEFVLPYFKEFVDQGHEYGYQVILHSCGSIYKVIPKLIDMGVDALHPLQARAANMDAETLAREFKGKITFIGGIDTQVILMNSTPDQVKDEVRRVKDLLGPNLVVSPSHEAILPNVPAANVEAMAQAALE